MCRGFARCRILYAFFLPHIQIIQYMNPLPLIEPQEPDLVVGDTTKYGYFLLALTWTLFVITINTLFKLWTLALIPLRLYTVYDSLYTVFETLDYYVLVLWGIYVLAWWWALVSWAGLKLFRHSKGLVK